VLTHKGIATQRTINDHPSSSCYQPIVISRFRRIQTVLRVLD
jgi:hypothetical protein